jgi:hypothetical protein
VSDRTVKAILIAEYAIFKEGVARAGESVEEFEERIRRLQDAAGDSSGTDRMVKEQEKVRDSSTKTSKAVEDVKTSIEDLGHTQLSITEVDTALGKAAEDAKVKGEEIGKGLGDGVEKGSRDLPERIKPTTDRLPEPFGPAGKKSSDRFKDMFSQDLAGSGVGWGDLLGSGIMGGIKNSVKVGFSFISQMPPEVQAPIAIAGGAAGVVLISALNGALLGGVGALGLAAGIIAEAKDPGIQEQFGFLKNQFSDTMTNAGHSFIVPVQESIGILNNAMFEMGDSLTSFEGKISPAVVGLARNFGRAADEVAQGLDTAGGSSEKILEAVGQSVAFLGGSVKVFLQEISIGGESGAQSIKLISVAAGVALDTLGVFFITAAMGWNTFKFGVQSALLPLELILKAMIAMHIAGGTAKNILDGINGVLGNNSSKARQAKGATDDLAGSMGKGADAAKKMADALNADTDAYDKLIGVNLGAAQSLLQFRNDLAAVTQAAQDNGTSLDQSTAAGRANMGALLDAAGAARSSAEALRDQTTASQGAAAGDAAFSSSLGNSAAQLYSTAVAAGFNKDAVAQMIASMLNVPQSVVSQFLAPGGAGVQALIDYINSHAVDKTVDITYNERHYTSYQQVQPGHGGSDPGGFLGTVHHAATGGVFDAGVYSNGPILFAEPQTGGEAFIPRQTPDEDRARRITEQAAAWHGGRVAWNNGPVQHAPMTGGGAAGAGLSMDGLAGALSSRLAPALATLARAVEAGHIISVQVDGREIMRAPDEARRVDNFVGW